MTVGGRGAPIGLPLWHCAQRQGLRAISRAGWREMGFLVVVLYCAASHGVTAEPAPQRGRPERSGRPDPCWLTGCWLGVRRAVFTGSLHRWTHGHPSWWPSAPGAGVRRRVLLKCRLRLGGSTSPSAPYGSIAPTRSTGRVERRLTSAPGDPRRLPAEERKLLYAQMASALARNARTPFGLPGRLSAPSSPPVTTRRCWRAMAATTRCRPSWCTVENVSGRAVCERRGYGRPRGRQRCTKCPARYHSWMLANPRHGADPMRQLLACLSDAWCVTPR